MKKEKKQFGTPCSSISSRSSKKASLSPVTLKPASKSTEIEACGAAVVWEMIWDVTMPAWEREREALRPEGYNGPLVLEHNSALYRFATAGKTYAASFSFEGADGAEKRMIHIVADSLRDACSIFALQTVHGWGLKGIDIDDVYLAY